MNPVVRLCIVLIFLSLVPGTGPALAQDFFTGRVMAVDLEKMEIEVLPHSRGKLSEDLDKEKVLVRIAEANNLPKGSGVVSFPDCVIVGENIRLWGNRAKSDGYGFLATDIRGCKGRGCSDPTGVRSRLSRARKNSIRRQPLPDSGEQEGGPGTHGGNRGGHGGAGNGGSGNGGGGGGR